jgi:hypothetical protein
MSSKLAALGVTFRRRHALDEGRMDWGVSITLIKSASIKPVLIANFFRIPDSKGSLWLKVLCCALPRALNDCTPVGFVIKLKPLREALGEVRLVHTSPQICLVYMDIARL